MNKPKHMLKELAFTTKCYGGCLTGTNMKRLWIFPRNEMEIIYKYLATFKHNKHYRKQTH